MATTHTPTTTAYPELELAYRHFNACLFDNALPSILITLQRKSGRCLGYYSPGRFVRQTGAKTDELAMNPAHFLQRALLDTLSTLAHEMVHVWQQYHGKPGRRGYHNKEWGAKMKKIGLYPSNTGKPGGKETGEQMTHYIVEDASYHRAALELIKTGFALTWAEYTGEMAVADPDQPGLPATKPKPKPKPIGRIKFKCPGCANNAWGKPGLKVACLACLQAFVPA